MHLSTDVGSQKNAINLQFVLVQGGSSKAKWLTKVSRTTLHSASAHSIRKRKQFMISLAQIQNDFTPLNEKDIIKLMD